MCEKLTEEEDRHDKIINHYQNSLHWLKLFHKKVGTMAKEQINSQISQQMDHQREMGNLFQQEMQKNVTELMNNQIK